MLASRTNQILAKHSIINLYNSLFALQPCVRGPFFSLRFSPLVAMGSHNHALPTSNNNSHKAPPVLQLCDLNLITIQYCSIKIYYQKLYTWNHNLAQFISAPIFAHSFCTLLCVTLPHSFSPQSATDEVLPNVHLFYGRGLVINI